MSKRPNKFVAVHFRACEIHDPDTGEFMGYVVLNDDDHSEGVYQITRAVDHERGYSVALVVHEEPFEYVDMGYHDDLDSAFSKIRQAIITSTLNRAISGGYSE